jgi:hypothetical protein
MKSHRGMGGAGEVVEVERRAVSIKVIQHLNSFMGALKNLVPSLCSCSGRALNFIAKR